MNRSGSRCLGRLVVHDRIFGAGAARLQLNAASLLQELRTSALGNRSEAELFGAIQQFDQAAIAQGTLGMSFWYFIQKAAVS